MNRTTSRRCALLMLMVASALGFSRPAGAAEALRVSVGDSVLMIPGGYMSAGSCTRRNLPGATSTSAPDRSVACLVMDEPVWDDFSESYLYTDTSKTVQWVTVSTGFFFGPTDRPCRSVPGVAGRSLRVTKDGQPANARLFSPTSPSRRAAVLKRFANTSAGKVARPPTDILRQVLVNCASGEAIFVLGTAAPIAVLRRIVQDKTDGGRLLMVDWVPASNPKPRPDRRATAGVRRVAQRRVALTVGPLRPRNGPRSPRMGRNAPLVHQFRRPGRPNAPSWATERVVLGEPGDLDDVRAVAAGTLRCYLRAAKKDCNSDDDSSARMKGVTAISWLKRASAQRL